MFDSRIRVVSATVLVLIAGASVACRGGALLREYEYDEEIYLALDGTATLYVNGSVPALVALRGLDLRVNPRARLDRSKVRAFYTAPGARVSRVSSSRRHGRRFVHLRIEAAVASELGAVAPLAWSQYRFERHGDQYVFRQLVGPSVNRPVGDVGWTGAEMVAFRVHLPSRIRFHTAAPGNLRRGNILVWEQPLSARLAGEPLQMEARIETQSILYRTLWLFGATALAAAMTFALVIVWIIRRGRDSEPSGSRGVSRS